MSTTTTPPSRGPTILTVEDLNEPEFLERKRQLRVLTSAYEESKQGHKRGVLLIGESGAGASRLLQTWQTGEVGDDEPIFHAAFREETSAKVRARPLMVMLALIYKAYGPLPSELTESDMAMTIDLGTLEYLVSNFDPREEQDYLGTIGTGEDEFWSAMTRFFVEHAKLNKLNLIFENVEFADAASTRFLEFWSQVPEERGAHLFWAATYATDTESRVFSRILPKLKRLEPISIVELPPLRALTIPAFFKSVIGPLKADETVYREAYKLSKGRPKILLGLIRDFVEKGLIRKRGDAWEIPIDAEISALPKELEEELVSGVTGVSKLHKEALEWSSAMASEFDAKLMSKLCGDKGARFGVVLQDLTKRRYWDEVEDQKQVYRYASPNVRNAIHDGMPDRRRKKVHSTIARELERTNPAPAHELARHHALAQQIKPEQSWSLRAGTESYNQGDWQTARKLLERVQELLEEQRKPPPKEVIEIHYRLARVARQEHRYTDVEELLREGLRLSSLTKDYLAHELRTERALLRYARGDASGFDQLRAAVEGEGGYSETPELRIVVADLTRQRNKPGKAADLLESIDLEHPEFPASEGRYRWLLGRLAYYRADWSEAEAQMGRAEEVCREQRHYDLLAHILLSMADLKVVTGDLVAALQLAETGIEYATEYGDPGLEARLFAFEARLLQQHGALEESLEAIKDAKRQAKHGGERMRGYVLLEATRWSLEAKQLDQGTQAGRQGLEIFERLGERWGAAGTYAALGEIYGQTSKLLGQAAQYFKFASEYYKELGAPWQLAFLAAPWARVLRKLGKRSNVLKEGYDLAHQHGMPIAKAQILLEMGRQGQDPQRRLKVTQQAYQLLRDSGYHRLTRRAKQHYRKAKSELQATGGDGESADD